MDLLPRPFILGTWLRDGHSNTAVITIGRQDRGEMTANLWRAGVEVREREHARGTIAAAIDPVKKKPETTADMPACRPPIA